MCRPSVVPSARCERDRIREMRSGPAGATTPESLRDAVYILEEHLQQWNSGAEGLPAAAVAVRSASAVETAWRDALESYDAGNPTSDARRSRRRRLV
jgi:hypothetical protein